MVPAALCFASRATALVWIKYPGKWLKEFAALSVGNGIEIAAVVMIQLQYSRRRPAESSAPLQIEDQGESPAIQVLVVFFAEVLGECIIVTE